MINPDDARIHLHELIDSMPDEQVALVWMTFQSMINTDDDVEKTFNPVSTAHCSNEAADCPVNENICIGLPQSCHFA